MFHSRPREVKKYRNNETTMQRYTGTDHYVYYYSLLHSVYHCALFMTEQPGDPGSTRTQAPTMAAILMGCNVYLGWNVQAPGPYKGRDTNGEIYCCEGM